MLPTFLTLNSLSSVLQRESCNRSQRGFLMQSLLAAGGVTPACPPPRPGAEVGALAQLPVSKAVASDVRLLRGVSTARSVDPESDAPPAAVTGVP